jgi:hypothetical protein
MRPQMLPWESDYTPIPIGVYIPCRVGTMFLSKNRVVDVLNTALSARFNTRSARSHPGTYLWKLSS